MSEQSSLSENVVNISNYVLDKAEAKLLGLGLNFALNPVKKHALDYIVNFDKFLAKHNYNKNALQLKDNRPLVLILLTAVTLTLTL